MLIRACLDIHIYIQVQLLICGWVSWIYTSRCYSRLAWGLCICTVDYDYSFRRVKIYYVRGTANHKAITAQHLASFPFPVRLSLRTIERCNSSRQTCYSQHNCNALASMLLMQHNRKLTSREAYAHAQALLPLTSSLAWLFSWPA